MPYQYKREPLTPDEANRLASACETHQERLIVWTLLDTGLRVSELAELTREHIGWQNHRLMIYGKGGWDFRCSVSVSIHVHFPPILHESTSHSKGYEHAPSIVGEAGCVHRRCVTPTPLAVPWLPGGRRCQSPR